MFETDADFDELDALLARSFDTAGSHLTGIVSAERRLDARDLATYLVGVKHLVVATTTAQGAPRCSAVDGLFLHGHFWFSTSATSFKVLHLEHRPSLSAAHVVGDDVGVFVHGSGRMVAGATDEAARLAPYWFDVYGATPEAWVETPSDARYVEIVPDTMFTYAFDRARFDALVAAASPSAPG